MGTVVNPVDAVVDQEARRLTGDAPPGPISRIVDSYTPDSPRLLGFLLKFDYEELRVVTCDAWKENCGGVPRNTFVIIKLSDRPNANGATASRKVLVLARVAETAITPVESDIQQTVFQIHKVQAQIDPFTDTELQWGALRADILGTYYDKRTGQDGAVEVAFGNDVDRFLSPHLYEIYVPTEEHLEFLINSFVAGANPFEIGRLRYTETETAPPRRPIQVRVSPGDFLSNRTALFGKTRMGKSNTIKVILDTILRSNINVGQVVFDLAGEYTYPDPQTAASLYLMHAGRCSRYSLNPRDIQAERDAGVPRPSLLQANFYAQVELGHKILKTVYPTFEPRPPDYIAPVLAWEPVDERRHAQRFQDRSSLNRYIRAQSMYFAVLNKAGYRPPANLVVHLQLSEDIRQHLATLAGLGGARRLRKPDGRVVIAPLQSIDAATLVYEKLYDAYEDPTNQQLFPPSPRTNKPYFEKIHEVLLRMLGDPGITGAGKFTRFTQYHSPAGQDIITNIVAEVNRGRTVFIDLANADEVVAGFYSELVTAAILAEQMTKFTHNQLGDHSVLFYFEEAHHLFRADDKDLTSVYNRLAKEGAKFRIGMVYATQSMTTLSPDLLKNTENFFIAHLNDDREIKEIERRYEFSGVGIDVQRARSKGYVRMITLSHRYALPVQVRLFAPPNEAGQVGNADASPAGDLGPGV